MALVQNTAVASETRSIVCRALARLGGDAQAFQAMLLALKDADAEVRTSAARFIQDVEESSATLPLITCLHNDLDMDVRIGALDALAFISDRKAIAVLIDVLHDTTQPPAIRGRAAEMLSLGRGRAVDALLHVLTDTVVDVRFWAVYALGEMRYAEALPQLEHIAANDHAVLPGWWTVSDESRWAIAEISNPEAADRLFDQLEETRHKSTVTPEE